jgi:hypothetical protein
MQSRCSLVFWKEFVPAVSREIRVPELVKIVERGESVPVTLIIGIQVFILPCSVELLITNRTAFFLHLNCVKMGVSARLTKNAPGQLPHPLPYHAPLCQPRFPVQPIFIRVKMFPNPGRVPVRTVRSLPAGLTEQA